MSRTAFLFPVKQEASGLLRAIQGRQVVEKDGVTCWIGRLDQREIVVGLLGMGADSVKRTLPLILKEHAIDFAWVAGFGGGLDASLHKGDVVLAENFSTPKLSFRHSVPRVKGVTVDHVVAGSTQKLALAAGHGAHVVDMESEIAHRIFEERGIAHATLRGISDPWNESLPAGALAASFDPEENAPTPIRLLLHLATHPGDVIPFFRFVIGLSAVQKNLTKRLLELESQRQVNQ